MLVSASRLCGSWRERRSITRLSAKLSFLLEQISPQVVEREATRVLSVAGVPVIASEASERPFDLVRLLEIRQTPECQAFRSWLQKTQDMSDDEIRQQVASLRARLGWLARTGQGKVLRLLVCTAAGLVSGAGIAGIATGAVMGALDSFAVDRLLPHSAPVAFLTRIYPSIFDR